VVKIHTWLTASVLLLTLFAAFIAYTGLHQLLRSRPQDTDAMLTQSLLAAKVPGAVLLTMQDGKIEKAQGYGLADPGTGKAVTPDTLFTVASISKTVTATALMTLFEQGRFGLDDDINRFLPFNVRNPAFPDTPITFRNLLMHTSGIRDSEIYEAQYTLWQTPQPPDAPVALGDFLRSYLRPGGSHYHADRNFHPDKPGTSYHYSNIAFGLVGYLVERICWMPFEQYCQQAVFKPLGMKRSAWHFKDVDVGQMAVPHGYDDLKRQPRAFGFYGYPTFPDGALKTSAIEFARFLAVFLNEGNTLDGKPFLQPSTVRTMLASHDFSESPASVGLAWHVKGDDFFHSGGDPGIFTLAGFNPATGRGFVFFSNGGDGSSLPGMARQVFFINRIQNLMKQQLDHNAPDSGEYTRP
jgi:CubicO group peptidase (beta-lactamase class C family)